MKYFKRPVLSLMLMCVLAGAAFADPSCADPGQTSSPPCACVPGQTGTPPCAAQSMNDDPVVPGQTNTPPAALVVNVTDIAETVLWSLLLF